MFKEINSSCYSFLVWRHCYQRRSYWGTTISGAPFVVFLVLGLPSVSGCLLPAAMSLLRLYERIHYNDVIMLLCRCQQCGHLAAPGIQQRWRIAEHSAYTSHARVLFTDYKLMLPYYSRPNRESRDKSLHTNGRFTFKIFVRCYCKNANQCHLSVTLEHKYQVLKQTSILFIRIKSTPIRVSSTFEKK